jgi:putative transport protein
MHFVPAKDRLMSDIALMTAILALVAVLGLWFGNFRLYGVSLGIGGVLFGGIIVGHFAELYGIALNDNMLHFIQEFGLILFVYTIGIQVGPGFFSSLRRSGLKLNGFALLIVLLGCLVTAGLHKAFNIPLPIILGIFSGAVTNTPSLGAGQQILTDLGSTVASDMGMGYAVTYPFGICGILLVMWLIRILFKVNVEHEAKEFEVNAGYEKDNLRTMNVELTNQNLVGLALNKIPMLAAEGIICSRLKRQDKLLVPSETTQVELGDYLHLVGKQERLEQARLVIGKQIDVSLSTQGSDFQVARVVVTNEKVSGKKIGALNLQQHGIVISRINRAGVELVPNNGVTLHFGDILNLVGKKSSIDIAANIVGNAEQKLQQVQMLPVFIGIGLGVLVGSIPLAIPGFPAPLRLGLAGGPLVIALILGRIGCIGKLYWFMPPSANLALRELGIVLFLAVVGLKSGDAFIATLIDGDGMLWMAYGAMITFIPLLITGVVARLFGRLNYLSLCGVLAGSMTDPPALAFANNIHANCGAAALSYATVYPLVMFLRIISPQILALIFWL